MALELVFARQAEIDVLNILAYIGAENPDAERRFAEKFDRTFYLLTKHPHLGPLAPSAGQKAMRKMSVPPYVIYYFADPATLRIARILHSAQDVTEEFFL